MEMKIYRKAMRHEKDCRIFHWVPSAKSENIEEVLDDTLDLASDLAELSCGGVEDIHLRKGNSWVSLMEEVLASSEESGESFDTLWEQSVSEVLARAVRSCKPKPLIRISI